MDKLTGIYRDAKGFITEKLTGRTESLRNSYMKEFYSQHTLDSIPDSRFDEGLYVSSMLRVAKALGNDGYMKAALWEVDALEKGHPNGDAASECEKIWINTEAYQASGNIDYIKRAKKHADYVVDERMKLGFVNSGMEGWESDAETQLMAASALLQLYDLSKAEKYRRKAEDILDFFISRHLAGSGGTDIVERLEVSVKGNDVGYRQAGGTERQVHLKELAAITFMTANRVTEKYSGHARRFFESCISSQPGSQQSLMMYSEAGKTFKLKPDLKTYKELLCDRLSAYGQHSLRDLVGVMNSPVFDAYTDDNKIFRDMAGVLFSLGAGMGIWSVLPYMPGVDSVTYGQALALASLINIASLPYMGRLADKYGRKVMLPLWLFAYSASMAFTLPSIENLGKAGIYLSQVARNLFYMSAGPIVSAEVIRIAPESKKVEYSSEASRYHTLGYAITSWFSGRIKEHANSLGAWKHLPFLLVSVPPLVMVKKLYNDYNENKVRKEMLDSIFREEMT